MKMTIESTAAKIGRSMKKREMFMGCSRASTGAAAALSEPADAVSAGRLDLHPRPDPRRAR